jgi:hypothetical protein
LARIKTSPSPFYLEQAMLKWLFSRENLAALLLCLIVLALIVLTTDQSPQWIYQGF